MLKARFYDIIHNNVQEPEEKKNGDEIVIDIVNRAGLELA